MDVVHRMIYASSPETASCHAMDLRRASNLREENVQSSQRGSQAEK